MSASMIYGVSSGADSKVSTTMFVAGRSAVEKGVVEVCRMRWVYSRAARDLRKAGVVAASRRAGKGAVAPVVIRSFFGEAIFGLFAEAGA